MFYPTQSISKQTKQNKYRSILPLMEALKDLSENATCDVRI